MKICSTKNYITPTKYDVPLPFNKRNITGEYIISCEDPLFIKGSPAKKTGSPAWTEYTTWQEGI